MWAGVWNVMVLWGLGRRGGWDFRVQRVRSSAYTSSRGGHIKVDILPHHLGDEVFIVDTTVGDVGLLHHHGKLLGVEGVADVGAETLELTLGNEPCLVGVSDTEDLDQLFKGRLGITRTEVDLLEGSKVERRRLVLQQRIQLLQSRVLAQAPQACPQVLRSHAAIVLSVKQVKHLSGRTEECEREGGTRG